MKILLVSHTGYLGGASNMLLALAKGIKPLGEVHCLMPVQNRGLGSAMAKAGVITGDSTCWIEKYIKDHKIDVVVSNTATIIKGAIAALDAEVPHIWYVHEILSKDPSLKPAMPLKDLYDFMHAAGKIVCVSESVRKEIITYSPYTNPMVVYNGVKTGRRERSSGHVVLGAGGICKRKDPLTFVRAAKIVIEQVPDAKFKWAVNYSKGTCFDTVKRERHKLGLSREQVTFHNKVSDMDAFYRTGNQFVSTATCEPFGLSILEAMSNGLPAVVTKSGGPEEIIRDRNAGYKVDIGDHYGVADSIMALFDDTDNVMGEEAYRVATTDFNLDGFIERFTEIIKSV